MMLRPRPALYDLRLLANSPLRAPIYSFAKVKPRTGGEIGILPLCDGANRRSVAETARRTANYHPSIWEDDTIRMVALRSTYMHNEEPNTRLEELKHGVKHLLESCEGPSATIRLIDSIQRLGIAYHFEKEIKCSIDKLCDQGLELFDHVHDAALCFRLLREHGNEVSTDAFQRFINEKGFKDCLAHDVKGLFSLYEAAHLGVGEEEMLEEAKELSAKHLSSVTEGVDHGLLEQVRHSLEVPLHWRMPRLEARHYIDVYGKEEGRSSVVLELATLDYNVVQSIHHQEMKELSRWWKGLGLAKKLPFSRDRLLENYLWAVGIASEPKFSKCRKGLTKLICILTVIDDIYDVYGLMEELEHFTLAINSWDPEASESLPEYMKLCYMALHNFVQEIADDILKDYGWDILPFIRREWERLCGAYLVEAKWFSQGYKPSLKEYLGNAWISVGGPVAMTHAYLLLGNTLEENSISCLQQNSELVYWSSLITRLSDDLGTSKAEMERGDVHKSMQCYMNETGKSEESSREHIMGLISHAWKELNKQSFRAPLPRNFINMVLNMARTAQCIFQHGDGIGTSTGATKYKISSLFIEHVPSK